MDGRRKMQLTRTIGAEAPRCLGRAVRGCEVAAESAGDTTALCLRNCAALSTLEPLDGAAPSGEPCRRKDRRAVNGFLAARLDGARKSGGRK